MDILSEIPLVRLCLTVKERTRRVTAVMLDIRRFYIPGLTWLIPFALCMMDIKTSLAGPGAFFPIGIYGVQTPEQLEVVKKAGFNTVVGPANATFLEKAQSLGLRVMASPGTSSGRGFNGQAMMDKIKAHDAHPALWSWYLSDEPDMQRIPPWKVMMDQRLLKSSHARSPTSIVLYHGANAMDYGSIPDFMMMDTYPIPWMPLAHFAQHLRWARQSLPREKPLFAVIQAFDWQHFKEHIPGETYYRAPSPEELKCMTYMALAQPVEGLFYYSLKAGIWDLLKHPHLWKGLKDVLDSLQEHAFLLQSERLWWIPSRRILPHELRRSATKESSISVTLHQDSDGLTHLLLINTTPHALKLELSMPESNNAWASAFQKDTPFNGFQPEKKYSLPFAKYQVRLLKGFHAPTFPKWLE
jgi:hypothetical protein